jgi:hypothetical protein
MAHKINDMLNKLEGKKPVKCNDKCKYWKFPHLDRACVLSDVFSVKKGELCFEYKKDKNDKN